MDHEEQITAIAKQMAEEIDFQVLSSFFIKDGWTRVELARFTNNNNAIDIADWAEEHCKDKYIKHSTTYVFKDSSDAVMFTLKWK
jgi:hypothetical protein